jgi:hypothetical protein
MSITGSVGLGGKNVAADVRLVQATINPHVAALGVALLDVDGDCGPLTRGAIKRYQQVYLKMPSTDSRVDPGGATLLHMANNPAPAGVVVTASRLPIKLKAGDFLQVPVVMDPADGTVQDAYTAFEYEIFDKGARMVGTDYAFGVPNDIEVWPNAQVRIGVTLDAGLLAHEQFHYDVGFVVCRALAHQLTIARAPTIGGLVTQLNSLVNLHINKRVKLIQRRYDIDTQHGANAKYQRIWLDRMTACIANPTANQIGGFWL